MVRFVLILVTVVCFSSFAEASTGPKHLISWAKQLHDISMIAVQNAANDLDNQDGEGQRLILKRVLMLLELSDIDAWTNDPVIVQMLEKTWEMETQFSMELSQDTFLRINWVEDHLNLAIEQEGEDGFTFILQGLIEIEEQDDGRVLLRVNLHEDIAHYQFHNEKTQETYFPGLIVDP